MKKISVIGGGSWATTIIKMFVENKTHVSWYLRKKENVVALLSTGRNPNYLSFLSLPLDLLHVSDDINEIINSSNTIIFAVPSAYLAALTDPDRLKEKNIITSIKGTVGEYNTLPSTYLSSKFDIPFSRQAIIAGPCHAEEIAIGRKTYVTIASENTTFGYYASKGIFEITAKQAIKAPIVSAIYRGILHNHLSPYNALKLLENQLQ